ncbi:MAG: chromate transporter [Tissierellaceae bacterium]|nr:chromate transporter [Tissierellaceae bacterium]
MIYLKLYLVFFRIGLFSVGGGLATLPFLQEIVHKYGWITSEELLNMIAVSESTPGPIGINTATYVGFNTGGVLGGLIATLGIVTPSIIIIVIIAHYFSKFSEEHVVKSAFYGIRPAVAGLIGAVGFELAKIELFSIETFNLTNKIMDLLNFKAILLFGIMFYLIRKFNKHPITYILLAAVIGVVFKF